MAKRDYYEVLGITKNASEQENSPTVEKMEEDTTNQKKTNNMEKFKILCKRLTGISLVLPIMLLVTIATVVFFVVNIGGWMIGRKMQDCYVGFDLIDKYIVNPWEKLFEI